MIERTPERTAERKPRSLLDFAIAASAAVLPVMLGMLLLVAVVRPAQSPPAAAGEPGRYLSVRQLAALKTFEAAVVARVPGLAPVPKAEQVLEGLPACRSAWSAAWRLPGWLAAPRPSLAEGVAAQLAQLDAALAEFSARPNARVDRLAGLDASRWFEAAGRALATPLDAPEAPGRPLHLHCDDLAAALSALLRSNARLLEALAWRGTEGAATIAHWAPGQLVGVSARELGRRNPWAGVAGCIYLGGAGGVPTHFVAGPRSAHEGVCGLPAMSGAVVASAAAGAASAPVALAGEPSPELPPGDPRWSVPPSLHAMLAPLESLRRPAGALYRLYTEEHTEERGGGGPQDPGGYRYGPNRVVMAGHPVDVGFSVDLTIDPALQALAQQVAACYTGRQDVCRALGVHRAEDRGQPIGHRLLEHAMVRMAAVAVVDVASGRIEALAGALSPCARQEVDGPGLGAGCDKRLPYEPRYRPDALLNPAVFHDAMPASTIKPIMAATFLSDREVGARWLAAERTAALRKTAPARESLRGQLMRSDSARFLDRMFCFDKNYAGCHRPWDIQAQALAFGWNAGCQEAHTDCGRQDLLFGRPVDATGEGGVVRPLATPVLYGRLMSEPVQGRLGAPQKLMPAAALDPAIVRRCAYGADGRRLSDDDWEKCRGGAVVDVVAEGWGQGHARASALGVAGMMSTLAAAANGQGEVHRPHLVEAVRGAGPAGSAALRPAVARWNLAQARAHGLPSDVAQVILDGLSYSHRGGTARTACEQVFDARSCRTMDWIAGKTGTPSFPGDGIPLDALAKLCRSDPPPAGRAGAACGSLRPYKWYVAAYRTDLRAGPWTKAIAVLTERNWLQQGGFVHGSGDHGPNPAAEIAMQVVGRQRGVIAGVAP